MDDRDEWQESKESMNLAKLEGFLNTASVSVIFE